MKNTLIPKYGGMALTALFGIIAFLFWRFAYPHALVYQEQYQLFLLLNGHQSVLHILGYVLVLHPDSVLVAVQCDKFLCHALRVQAPDGGGQVHLVVLQSGFHSGVKGGLHIVGENADEKQTRADKHEQNAYYYLQAESYHAPGGAGGDIGRGTDYLFDFLLIQKRSANLSFAH